MVLNWVSGVDRKLWTFHSDFLSLVGELTKNHQGLTVSFDDVAIRMFKVIYLLESLLPGLAFKRSLIRSALAPGTAHRYKRELTRIGSSKD